MSRALIMLKKDGKWPDSVGRPQFYFEQRHTFLDLRGPVTVHQDSHWGYEVMVLSRSHDVIGGAMGKPIDRPVVVEREAWIGSRALLYNCIVREGAIVAAGAVIRSCEVMPRVIVAGNPALVVARWSEERGRWRWVGWPDNRAKWRTLS